MKIWLVLIFTGPYPMYLKLKRLGQLWWLNPNNVLKEATHRKRSYSHLCHRNEIFWRDDFKYDSDFPHCRNRLLLFTAEINLINTTQQIGNKTKIKQKCQLIGPFF